MDKELAIKAIDEFCAKTNIQPSSVGQMSVSNRRAYESIKRGSASLNTTLRVLEWVAEQTKARNLTSGDAAQGATV